MKKIIYLLLIGMISESCQKENTKPELKNFDHLKDVVLEITDRENVQNGESDIFNAYIHAIKFNSNGTYELLDDNYGQNDYWTSRFNELHWSLADDQITFEFNGNDEPVNFVWKIIKIEEDQLIVQETTIVDKIQSQHILRTSNKQQIQ